MPRSRITAKTDDGLPASLWTGTPAVDARSLCPPKRSGRSVFRTLQAAASRSGGRVGRPPIRHASLAYAGGFGDLSRVRHDNLDLRRARSGLVEDLRNRSPGVLRVLLDDPFDLAAVDAELAGDGSLACTGFVPGSYHLLQRWRLCHCGWSALLHVGHGLVPDRVWRAFDCRPVLSSDEGREELEGTDQRQGGPCADQRAYRPVPEAVCQVGADGGDNASPQAPPRQSRYGPVMPVGVEDQHARRPDEAIHREWDEPGGQARLPVRADQLVGVPVGDHRRDRGDRGNGESRRDPDELVRH